MENKEEKTTDPKTANEQPKTDNAQNKTYTPNPKPNNNEGFNWMQFLLGAAIGVAVGYFFANAKKEEKKQADLNGLKNQKREALEEEEEEEYEDFEYYKDYVVQRPKNNSSKNKTYINL